MGKIKGSIFVKVVKALRAKRQEVEASIPPELRHYLDSRVLVTSWFEETHYHQLMQVVASRVSNPGLDVWEYLGRDSARVDYEGVYRSFIESKGPAQALKGFQILWPLRHDTGRVTIEVESTGRAAVELDGYVLEAEEIYRSIRGTLWQTLHMAGATNIDLRLVSSPPTAPICRWEATWSEQPEG